MFHTRILGRSVNYYHHHHHHHTDHHHYHHKAIAGLRPLWPIAGSSGGDQSGRINYSHSIIQEFARLDWMGLSGGDKTSQNNFPTFYFVANCLVLIFLGLFCICAI